MRHAFCVFGSHAIRYAAPCLLSMLRHSLDPLRLTVLTDGEDDAQKIALALKSFDMQGRIEIFTAEEAHTRAESHYLGFDHV